MVVIIIGCLGILTFIFSTYLFKDLANNKYRFENQTSFLITSIIGFITNFFDTLGIGSFAPLTALLRGFKQIEDKLIPGTLNVSVTIPVMIEAFVFITIIKVEKITLVLMIIAAIIGSAIGAGILSKLSEKLIRSNVKIFHYGNFDDNIRQQKFKFYNNHDPDSSEQDGYLHMISEKGKHSGSSGMKLITLPNFMCKKL